LPEWTEDSFAGILLNVAAGRVANRFDFGGTNFTVDAACASSLAAVHLAVRELQCGSSDMVIAGGADTVQSPFGFLCFSSAGALSPGGRCRPFDAGADGIAISEGLGIVVLKRLADAERDGDRIYAVIDGTGGSSDGRAPGLTAPRPSGQRLAVERAYAQAGVPARTVGLVEAHGTGTVVGDAAEIETLIDVYGRDGAPPRAIAIGSVKSMIGHTKCAAGMAGLIKASLALHHRILPPTLHVSSPNAKLTRADSPFYVNTAPRPWLVSDVPRRAAVSSFGFGGTNFHAVLQEYEDSRPGQPPARPGRWPHELFIWSAQDPDGIRQQLRVVDDALADRAEPALRSLAVTISSVARPYGPCVLAIVASSLADLRLKLSLASSGLAKGRREMSDQRGIYYADRPAGGQLAFLFPGQGSQYPRMLEELAVLFPEVRDRLEAADRVLPRSGDAKLSDTILPPPAFTPADRQRQSTALTETSVAQPALGAVDLGASLLLETFGIRPQMTAGHSYGEWVALAAAGALDEEALYRLSKVRGAAMASACPPGQGAMVAVSAAADDLVSALDGIDGVWLANLNGPRQTVISGSAAAIGEATDRLEAAGMRTVSLQVSSAFHSPLVSAASLQVEVALRQERIAAPRCPVYCNATANAYAFSSGRIVDGLVRQITSPVLFVEMIQQMYHDGARVFLETGPRQVLTGLVGQILDSQAHTRIALEGAGGGLRGLLHALAQLAVAGVEVDLDRLASGRDVNRLDLDRLVEDTAPRPLSPTTWLVSGGEARPLHSAAPRRQDARTKPAGHLGDEDAPPSMPSEPTGVPTMISPSQDQTVEHLLAGHLRVMARLVKAHEHVMMAWLREATPAGALGLEGLTPLELTTPAVVQSALVQPEPPHPSNEPPIALIPDTRVERRHDAPQPVAAMASETVPDNRAAAQPNRNELVSRLIKIISDRTGYPTEVVTAETALQTELGIDSIKKVEILATFQRGCDLGGEGCPSAMEQLVRASTPGQAVDIVLDVMGQTSATTRRPLENGVPWAAEGDQLRYLPTARDAT
jgi:acyl transferase domain-containing protein